MFKRIIAGEGNALFNRENAMTVRSESTGKSNFKRGFSFLG